MTLVEDRLHSEIARLKGDVAKAEASAEYAQRRYQELSHRVRNEFHQVAALTRLQEAGSVEPERCRQCTSNITAFSELHRLLDVSGLEAASMSRYLTSLQRSLELALEGRCRLRVEVEEDIVLPPQAAARLGVIITEAVINAAKHAFPEGADGLCEAKLRRSGADLHLTVCDNGRGFDEDRAPGQGSRLMQALAAQMGGRLDYPDMGEGACVRVIAPAF